MEKKNMNLYYRIGVVVVLVAAVASVIVLKAGRDRVRGRDEVAAVDSVVAEPLSIDTVVQELEAVDTGTVAIEQPPSLPRNVLALVNGEEVTQNALNKEFDGLPQQYKDYFEDDKAGFLEELILKRLLLQDARRKKVTESADYKAAAAQNPAQKEQIMINVLFREIIADITVTEPELKEFFEQYKDQLPVKDYDAVKEQLRPMLFEEKQRVVIEDYTNKLKSSAEIIRNEQWIKAQEALTADNPLAKALRSGRPVVADFGRGTCVPCKMMQPILEKLQKDYEGRAEILILDVGEYAALSRKYRIMMIPTQIFFDANGMETERHQGFMPEADIIAQLKKMGVE